MEEAEISEETTIIGIGPRQEVMEDTIEEIELLRMDLDQEPPAIILEEIIRQTEIIDIDLRQEIIGANLEEEMMIEEETEIDGMENTKKVSKIKKMENITGIGVKLQMVR